MSTILKALRRLDRDKHGDGEPSSLEELALARPGEPEPERRFSGWFLAGAGLLVAALGVFVARPFLFDREVAPAPVARLSPEPTVAPRREVVPSPSPAPEPVPAPSVAPPRRVETLLATPSAEAIAERKPQLPGPTARERPEPTRSLARREPAVSPPSVPKAAPPARPTSPPEPVPTPSPELVAVVQPPSVPPEPVPAPPKPEVPVVRVEPEPAPPPEPQAASKSASLPEPAAAPAPPAPKAKPKPKVAALPVDLRVQRTIWHPKPERRSAFVTIPDRADAVELREGDRLEDLVVARIEPGGVVFLHEGQELRRGVGQ
jgi:hypothetical protein